MSLHSLMCFRNHPESKQLMRIWNIKLIKLSCVDKVFDFLKQIAGFCQWMEAGQEVPTYGRDEQCCAGSDERSRFLQQGQTQFVQRYPGNPRYILVRCTGFKYTKPRRAESVLCCCHVMSLRQSMPWDLWEASTRMESSQYLNLMVFECI